MAGPLARRRPAGRTPVGFASRLASRLTERDRRIALDCYDHRLLTTEQLRRLHFATLRVAQRRLNELYELRVLDRFRPTWQRGDGSTPFHWLLDHGGALVVAELLDLPVDQLAWRRDHAHALASSSKRDHQLAVNEFFTRLAEDARLANGSLSEWWGERRTAAAFAGRLQPDGYGHLEINSHSIRFLLELDRGTEPHARLEEKAVRYSRELPRSELGQHQPLVLLLAPSVERTAAAANSVAGSAVPIHTATWTPTSSRTPIEVVRTAAASEAPTRLPLFARIEQARLAAEQTARDAVRAAVEAPTAAAAEDAAVAAADRTHAGTNESVQVELSGTFVRGGTLHAQASADVSLVRLPFIGSLGTVTVHGDASAPVDQYRSLTDSSP